MIKIRLACLKNTKLGASPSFLGGKGTLNYKIIRTIIFYHRRMIVRMVLRMGLCTWWSLGWEIEAIIILGRHAIHIRSWVTMGWRWSRGRDRSRHIG
jgi:hypothetical protein